jgi:HAD superfamily hydrolase (TIGR01484 family)
MTQGIVALDIDGTLLLPNQPPPKVLSSALASMQEEGWKILFATGRTVAWSLPLLEKLPFPFYLAAFNGATLFSYPDGAKIHALFLLLKDILAVAPYIDRFGVFLYEMGGEERVFAAKKNYSDFLKNHLERRRLLQK